jgi:hypothetical protein
LPQFLPKNCLWLQSDAVLADSVSILKQSRESGHYPKGADLRFLEVYFAFLQVIFQLHSLPLPRTANRLFCEEKVAFL